MCFSSFCWVSTVGSIVRMCYIKYFDNHIRGKQVRKYPVLKVYIHSKVYPVESGELVEQDRLLVGTVLVAESGKASLKIAILEGGKYRKQFGKEVHFYSPTTKLLIEEIYADSALALDTTPPPNAKRRLKFEEGKSLCDTKKTQSKVEKYVPAQLESPSKKPKGKENEV